MNWEKLTLIGLLLVGSLRAEINYPKEIIQAESGRDWATVAELSRRWLLADPKQTHLHGKIAQMRLALGDAQQCEEWLKKWETLTKKSWPLALELRGDMAWKKQDKARALDLWMQAYRAAPEESLAAKTCQEDAWPEDKTALRQDWLRQVGKTHLLPEAISTLATDAIRQRKWKDLAALVARLNRSTNRAHVQLAEGFTELAGSAKELSKLDAAVKASPSWESLLKRAQFFASKESAELAKEDAEASLKLGPESMSARILAGKSARVLGQTKQAETSKVCDIEPETEDPKEEDNSVKLMSVDREIIQESNPEKLARRARLLHDLRQPFLALEDLEQVLKGTPDDESALALQGECWRAAAMPREAIASFKKVLAKNPEHPLAHERLLQLQEERANYAAAIRHAERLAALDPANAAKYQAQIQTYRDRIR